METYTKTIQVVSDDLDDLNHVNNVRYVQWMQDIAKEHWQSRASIAMQEALSWVVLKHTINYKGAAKLDEISCNFLPDITEATVMPPLSTETGVRSDNNVVLVRANIPKAHQFQKKRFQYQPITEKGTEEFVKQVTLMDWSEITTGSASEAANNLCVALETITDMCFPKIWVNYKSTDDPWITREIRRKIRKRKRLYKKEGKSGRYKALRDDIKKLIEEKKQKEIDKVIHHWEEEGIRVEKARWGRSNIIKGKVKIELPKTVDATKLTLAKVEALIEKNAPKKKTAAKRKTTAKKKTATKKTAKK